MIYMSVQGLGCLPVQGETGNGSLIAGGKGEFGLTGSRASRRFAAKVEEHGMVKVGACICVGVTSIGVLDAEGVLGHHTIFARRRDREVKSAHGMAAATWRDGHRAIFCEDALRLVLREEPGLKGLGLDNASGGGCVELVKP